MNRHKHTKIADDDSSKRDWKKNVEIAEVHYQHRQRFTQILKELETMFDSHLEQINVVKHCVALEHSSQQPVNSTPYSAGLKSWDFENKKSSEWFRRSRWSSPGQLDGPNSVRPEERLITPLLRRLSKTEHVTLRDSWLLPHMDDCIDSSGDASVFSNLDVSGCCCHAEEEEADQDKTAFSSCHGRRHVQWRLSA